MQVLIVNQSEVSRLLPMDACMEAMARALAAVTRGEARLPLRQVLMLPDQAGAFAVMPAYLGSLPALGLKAITVFPGNHGTELDSHQGAVLLFETRRGSLRAVMDASSITAIRTAAVSGVATRLLARADAGDLALIGTGVQALKHLESMSQARRLRRVRAWSRSAENVRAFVGRAQRFLGIAVEPAAGAREAAKGADLVCTVTSSREPVLEGEWLAPGAHVNAVGASLPTARELDTAAVVRARLFVDRRESALSEAGDFLVPRSEGAIDDSHIRGELGELLLGQCAGRRSESEVTVFKSLGLAVEDVASAQLIYDRALKSGLGSWVELGGARDAGG
ncbi:MAG: ornithine cyclodeaminase [Acidobacteria bacterium]|nr:MAG: ornithine cyclodeaminase [Acidobacteriota bacterium]